jgi:hypothetical protein
MLLSYIIVCPGEEYGVLLILSRDSGFAGSWVKERLQFRRKISKQAEGQS